MTSHNYHLKKTDPMARKTFILYLSNHGPLSRMIGELERDLRLSPSKLVAECLRMGLEKKTNSPRRKSAGK